MIVKQLTAVAIAVAAVSFLMTLPKYIINHDNKTKLNTSGSGNVQINKTFEITEKELLVINQLRKNFESEINLEKKCTFADSLAKLYLGVGYIDSAIYYAERIVLSNTGNSFRKSVADIYFNASNMATDQELAKQFSEKANKEYQALLSSNPEDLDAKSNLAMTYVNTDTPMRAIALLREVLQVDSNHIKAQFNLGYLAILSGQYEKALMRFEKLLSKQPRYWKARLYYGIALKETGNKEMASEQFRQVAANERDPALVSDAQYYLKNLK